MIENDEERINASFQCNQSKIYAAKKLSRWFSIFLRIQIFGQTIFEREWSPYEKGGEE